jgi:hypothetical protein
MKYRYDMNMSARSVVWHYKGSRLEAHSTIATGLEEINISQCLVIHGESHA